jgi:hypothetical protein
MSDEERQLLQRLAREGKATSLSPDEYLVAVFLETNGLALIIRNTTDAIITPKGRNMLAGKGPDKRTVKKPFGFTPD